MATKQKVGATVSGPEIDRTYESPAIALSAAITFAERAADGSTFYVRHPDGSPYGRTEKAGSGTLVYCTNRKEQT